jgi:hypothetical protein
MAPDAARQQNRQFFQFVGHQRRGSAFSIRRFRDVHLPIN